MGRVTTRTRVTRIDASRVNARPDTLVVEEPLEIRVAGRPLAVTMRTPGSDVELAQGFMLTEGLIGDRSDIAMVRYCRASRPDDSNAYNVLDIDMADGVTLPDIGIERNFYTTSSCGVCGKASLDAIVQRTRHSPIDDPVVVEAATLSAMPTDLRTAQKVFASTGGLHAAGLFTSTGDLIVLREDVGRHNAVDKVIGWALENGRVPLVGTVLFVSGRASFELAQKAVMAGIPVLAAVSAPSSLAVELAQSAGLTLVGFVRGQSMNVYTHPRRIVTAAELQSFN